MERAAVLDPRVERTRNQLRTAVLELAETRDLGTLTVHDITRNAGINRATFYQHYRDKDELIEEAVDELLHELFEGCAPVLAGVDHLTHDVVHPSVIHMFEEIERRADLYRRLIGHGGSAYFIRRFLARNQELFLQAWGKTPQGIEHIPAEARARFGASATLGIFSYWLEEGTSEPPETIAAWFWRLVRPVWFDSIDNDIITVSVPD
jgi:AcrR family transcriptional regulator